MVLASPAGAREYYELLEIRLKSEEKAAAFDRAMEAVFLPVIASSGVGPVGVFKPREPKDEDGGLVLRYVLATYASIDGVETMRAAMVEHEGVDLAPARPYLVGEGGDDVAFDRISSSLLVAFEGFPEIEVPEGESPERFFELRVYESPSELKARAKVHMFDHGGELAIFEKVGLKGVFFGQALIGSNLPQLTYMLVYEDEAAKAAAWKAFGASPDWEELKGVERYAGTVSKIHSRDLVALPYSGIR